MGIRFLAIIILIPRPFAKRLITADRCFWFLKQLLNQYYQMPNRLITRGYYESH